MSNFWSKIKKPFVVLAPMENVTDHVFREIVAKELPKPDVMFTEFTNVEALCSAGFDKTIHRFKFSKNQRPIVAQIWGMKPENYYIVAKMISDLGFDGIDINMGCPDRAVIKMGACSALINNRPLAKEIIDATKKGSNNLPVSVKTRIGAKVVVTEDWISFLLEQKIAALTVHGRTAKQLSDVPADWNEISKAVELRNKMSPETVIIGNGDIKNYQDAIEHVEKYKVDGVMIGRGIFSNPWAFEKEKTVEHSPSEYINILVKHLDFYNKFYKGNRHYDVMKKFFKMYINNFKGANQLRIKLMETKTIEQAKELL